MDIKEMINLYNEGKSLSFLANKYGTYGAKIKQLLIENGVKTRTHAEQNRITNQLRARKVNHEFFNTIDCNEKAWLLGFLAADGAIAKDRNLIKLGLSSVDREILVRIKEIVGIEKDILDYTTNQGFQISELAWSSEYQKRALAKYDIVNNKTYKQMHLPPFDLEKQLSYILGYYDGDGCFRNDGQYCRMEICSYRSELLEEFAVILNSLTNSHINVYHSPSRENYYTLTYSTNATVTILNQLYKLNPNLYLQRKYDKYKEWALQNNRI